MTLKDQGSEIWYLRSEIRDLRLGIRDPGPEIGIRSRIRDERKSGSAIWEKHLVSATMLKNFENKKTHNFSVT